MGNGQYYDPHTGRFLTRGVNLQQTNPYVPWAADPSGMLFAPLALFSLVYGRRKKQAAKWKILLLVLLMGGSLVLGLAACGGGPGATPTVQAPSVPEQSTLTLQGGTMSSETPDVNGTPNADPTTTCVVTIEPTKEYYNPGKAAQFAWENRTKELFRANGFYVYEGTGINEATGAEFTKSNCANFVSFALRAGGLKENDTWNSMPEKSYSWVNVDYLYDYLKYHENFSELGEFNNSIRYRDYEHFDGGVDSQIPYLWLRQNTEAMAEEQSINEYWSDYLDRIQGAKEGDLVFYEDENKAGWSHVGIIYGEWEFTTHYLVFDVFERPEPNEPMFLDHDGKREANVPRSIGDSSSSSYSRVAILKAP